jgi:hypothetical protein
MDYRGYLVSGLLVGTLAASSGCLFSEVPLAAQRVPIEPLSEAQTWRFNSGMTMPRRLVVRDEASWQDAWHEMTRSSPQTAPTPVVDFTSRVVIVAAMGWRESGGHAISIDEVHVMDGDAWVSVTELSPGVGCFTTQALTAPVAVVLAPRFDGDATYVEDTGERGC